MDLRNMFKLQEKLQETHAGGGGGGDLLTHCGHLLSSLSDSIPSAVCFRGRWSAVAATVDRLSSALTDLFDLPGAVSHPLAADLLHSLPSSLADALALSRLCASADPPAGKLRTQSDLAAAASSLHQLTADAELLLRSGALLDPPTCTSSVRAIVTRLQIGTLDSRAAALDALAALIRNDDKNAAIAAVQGVLPPLVRLLDSPYKGKAAAAVARIAAVQSCRHVLAAEGSPLLNHLARVLECDDGSAEHACVAIQALTLTRDGAMSIATRGGVLALINICQAGTPSARAAAAAVLINLAGIEELRSHFLEENVIPVLISVISSSTPMAAKPETSSAVNGAADPSAVDLFPAVAAAAPFPEEKKWPGWPGDNVFHVIVHVLKVGGIIGRKGDIIKKLCEETRAWVRVLVGPVGSNDRIMLVSGKEEPEAEVSPAMDVVLRIFKRTNGISEIDGAAPANPMPPVCSFRLLVAASQAINLIGKHGSLIKSIQESSGSIVRVLTGDELPPYATADERIVDIQGEPVKVLRALESVVEHLRKFLVDHSVLPLFEKSLTASVAQEPQPLVQTSQQATIGNDYLLPKRDSYTERESQMDPHRQRSGLSLYGQDPALASLRPPTFGRTPGSLVTQITQTMQIPLGYAEDIIGVSGRNIGFIRNTSGAVVTVHESRGNPDDIIIEIKGTTSQVQNAQQLIEDFVNKGQVGTGYGGAEPGLGSSYAEPVLRSSYAEPGLRSSYGEPGFRSSYLGSSAYSSSLGEPPLGGYGSSGLGSYNSYTRY